MAGKGGLGSILGENHHNTSSLDERDIIKFMDCRGEGIIDPDNVVEIKRSRYPSVSLGNAIWIAVGNRREPSNFANVSVTTRS